VEKVKHAMQHKEECGVQGHVRKPAGVVEDVYEVQSHKKDVEAGEDSEARGCTDTDDRIHLAAPHQAKKNEGQKLVSEKFTEEEEHSHHDWDKNEGLGNLVENENLVGEAVLNVVLEQKCEAEHARLRLPQREGDERGCGEEEEDGGDKDSNLERRGLQRKRGQMQIFLWKAHAGLGLATAGTTSAAAAANAAALSAILARVAHDNGGRRQLEAEQLPAKRVIQVAALPEGPQPHVHQHAVVANKLLQNPCSQRGAEARCVHGDVQV
jgi:hypothetical protein